MTLLQFILIQLNLIAFFGLYRIFASRKGHFHFNRFFLLIGPGLAILLPFLSFREVSNSTFAVLLPAIEIIKETGELHSAAFNWTQLVVLLVSVLMLSLLILSLIKILRPKRAKFECYYKGYAVYMLEDQASTTHSIFNKIYIHPSHFDHKEIVLEHEYAHCRSFHSVDLIILSLYRSLFWFNPIIYSWTKEVQLNHEYLADAYVLSNGFRKKSTVKRLSLSTFLVHPAHSLIHSISPLR